MACSDHHATSRRFGFVDFSILSESDGLMPRSRSIRRPVRQPTAEKFLDRYWDLTDGLVLFFANEDRVKFGRAGTASVGVDRHERG